MSSSYSQPTEAKAHARRWPLQLLSAMGQGALTGLVGVLPGAATLAALEATQPQLPRQIAQWVNVEAPTLRYATAWPKAVSARVTSHLWLSYRFSPAQRIGLRLASRLGVGALTGAVFGPLAVLSRSGANPNGRLTGGAARQYAAGLGYGLALYAARTRARRANHEPLPALRDMGLTRFQREVIHAGGHALYGVALGALTHQSWRILGAARRAPGAEAGQPSGLGRRNGAVASRQTAASTS
ncbi:MAG TPA: hypothetical protein VMV29_09705 [Ktedonobacterales bacterium]|nr:hypothetical protein [Ktedonobacterales bacterium]